MAQSQLLTSGRIRSLYLGFGAVFVTLFLAVLFGQALRAPFEVWQSARLLFSESLWRGIPLYTGPDTGAALGNVYGPVSFFAYLPVVAFSSVTAKLIGGSVLSILFVTGPLIWLCLSDRFVKADRAWRALVLAITIGLVVCLAPMLATARNIHVDAAAIGLGLSSIASLHLGVRARRSNLIVLAALLSVLSVFAKQISLPLLMAQFAFLFITSGYRSAARFAFASGAFALVSFAIFAAYFGVVYELFFNMVIVPGKIPFKPFADAAKQLAEVGLAMLPFLALGLLSVLLSKEWRVASFRRRLIANPAYSFWAVALVALPFGCVAVFRIGGAANSVHSLFYLCAGTALAMLQVSPRREREPIALALCLVLILLAPARQSLNYLRMGEVLRSNPQEDALRLAQSYPNEIYFPWYPLTSVLNAGQATHFIYEIFNRAAAGYPLSAAHFAAHAPRQPRYIAYHRSNHWRDEHQTIVLPYYPGYDQKTILPAFSEWIFFERTAETN